jgi:hypothetical protein
MLLWITDTPDDKYETSEVIIRSPKQINAIFPANPTFVVIDIRTPVLEVISWASKRQQPTLWWLPVSDVPKAHCYVESAECSSAEFIPLLSDIYHRNGIINVEFAELESVINSSCAAHVSYVLNKNGSLLHHQWWPLGYVIHRNLNASIDDFQYVTELAKTRFKIKLLTCLIIPDGGDDLILMFRGESI